MNPPTAAATEVVLEAEGLTKHFPVRRSGRELLQRSHRVVHAVDDVSLVLRRGKVTALVGESGSGKSTVARLLAQLYPRTAGDIRLHGESVTVRGGSKFRGYVRRVQMIFQDPFASLNPVHTVRYHLTRALKIHGRAGRTADELEQALHDLLRRVQLTPPERYLDSFPHELSGGQRQRVAIARALGADPEALLADEPVSMLDVSIRLGILNLLRDLRDRLNLAILYITHDIASARYFADETMVMYAGRMVEGGDSETVTQRPAHPYTQLLIDSAPDPDQISAHEAAGTVTEGVGEPPSLITPPDGCRFNPRCPHVMERCKTELPPRLQIADAPGHWAACWLYAKDAPKQKVGLVVVKYLLQRLAFYAFTAWAAITINFFIPRIMPGDPVMSLINRYQGQISTKQIESLYILFGLDKQKSMWQEYVEYWGKLFQGDLGLSFTFFPTPVSEVIGQSLPWTLALVGVTTIVSFLVGTGIGVFAGWKRGTWIDSLIPASTFLSSIPFFWLGLIFIWAFTGPESFFPASNGYEPGLVPSWDPEFIASAVQHSLLPAFTILLATVSGWMLGMRNMMVSVASEDYITVAHAKGLSERRVMWRYAARNALLPNVSGFALSLGFIVSGTLLVEIVFSYPGLGYILFQAVGSKDYPTMQGIFLIITLSVLVANLMADVIYVLLDPRTRREA